MFYYLHQVNGAKLSNALSNGTIADLIRLLLPPNNTLAAMLSIVL